MRADRCRPRRISNNLAVAAADTAARLENSKGYFNGVDELMDSLNNSVDDAKIYSEKMTELSRNITSLNTVYGNMLTAMNPNANS